MWWRILARHAQGVSAQYCERLVSRRSAAAVLAVWGWLSFSLWTLRRRLADYMGLSEPRYPGGAEYETVRVHL